MVDGFCLNLILQLQAYIGWYVATKISLDIFLHLKKKKIELISKTFVYISLNQISVT